MVVGINARAIRKKVAIVVPGVSRSIHTGQAIGIIIDVVEGDPASRCFGQPVPNGIVSLLKIVPVGIFFLPPSYWTNHMRNTVEIMSLFD